MRGVNDDEIVGFCRAHPRTRDFRAFHRGYAGSRKPGLQAETYLSSDDILQRLAAYDALSPVPGPSGNGPARYFAFEGARGAVGVISPLSHDYCERCNRVRLTAGGSLRLCLFGDHAVDLRGPLRAGATTGDLAALMRASMLIKPERHHLRLGEASSRMRAFSEIGG